MAMLEKEATEVRFTVDADFLRKLQQRLGIDKATYIARAALTLLDWASAETEKGRIVLSSDDLGKEVHRLVMPEFSRIRLPGAVGAGSR